MIWATHTPVLAGITDSMVTETDIVSTQKVGERWSNRRMRSNFIWGQKTASFGRVVPALLCFLRTREQRSPTPSGPPSASALLRENAWPWYLKHRRIFNFEYLLCNGIEKYCQKVSAYMLCCKMQAEKWIRNGNGIRINLKVTRRSS